MSGRVVALFRPGSVAAALASARKVTHYGKYGYLAFTDGENRTKGTFPVETPESVVVFPGEEGR